MTGPEQPIEPAKDAISPQALALAGQSHLEDADDSPMPFPTLGMAAGRGGAARNTSATSWSGCFSGLSPASCRGFRWTAGQRGRGRITQTRQKQAIRLWGAAEALREEIGCPLPQCLREEYNRNVAVARQTLGAEAFSAAWIEGHAMTLEQAVAYALEEGAVPTQEAGA